MSINQEKISVTVDVIGNVDSLQSAFNKIQSQTKKQKIGFNFDQKSIKNFNDALNSMKANSGPLMSINDMKAVSSSWSEAKIQLNAYIKAYKEYLKQAKKNPRDAYDNTLSPDIKKAKDALEDYQRKQAEVIKQVQKGNGQLTRAQNAQAKAQASGTALETRYQKILDDYNQKMNQIKLSADSVDIVKRAFDELGLTWDDNADEAAQLAAIIQGTDAGYIKFTKDLDGVSVSIEKLGNEAKGTGAVLKAGLLEIQAGVEKNRDIEQLTNRLRDLFSLGSAALLFRRAINSAFSAVKELDAVMTETAVVTEYSVSDMWDMIPMYTEMANKLGATTKGAYETATLYYQQGLETKEVMAVTTETMKMARIAGLDYATATDYMTAALRGFNMEVNEINASRVNDVYSELAAITAADTEEISVAMTKVASLANNANMEFETTAAFLSQIVETTRESAETAGTALKTVVARFSEVKKLYDEGELLGTDEEGEEIDVNKVSEALRVAGINLNEYLTGSKGLDDIFLELASKWDSLDIVTQRYIATMAAGSRQQSRFIAMMSNYGRTLELVDAAYNSAGAGNRQFEKTLDSLESKLNQLKNAWDQLVMGVANSDFIKFFVDLGTNLLTVINNLISKISGSNGFVKAFSTIILTFTLFKVGSGIVNSALGKVGKTLGNVAEEGKTFGSIVASIGYNFSNTALKIKKISTKDIKDSFDILKIGATELLTTLGSILPYLVAIGATIGVIYAVVKTFKASNPIYNINNQVESLNKEIEETSEKVETLRSSLTSIKSSQEYYETLTEGTDEWRQATSDLNQEISFLVDQIPELEKFVSLQSGRLVFDTVSAEEYLNFLQDKEINNRSYQQYLLGQAESIKNEDILEDFNKRLSKTKITDKEFTTSDIDQNGMLQIDENLGLSSEQVTEILNIWKEIGKEYSTSAEQGFYTGINADLDNRLVEKFMNDYRAILEKQTSAQLAETYRSLYGEEGLSSFIITGSGDNAVYNRDKLIGAVTAGGLDDYISDTINKYEEIITLQETIEESVEKIQKDTNLSSESATNLVNEWRKTELAIQDAIEKSKALGNIMSEDFTDFQGVADIWQDVFGSSLTSDFVEKNKDLFQELTDSNTETAQAAYEELRKLYSIKYATDNDWIDGSIEKVAELESLINSINGLDVSVGGSAEFGPIYDELIRVMGGVNNAKAFIESLGFKMEYQYTDVPVYTGSQAIGKGLNATAKALKWARPVFTKTGMPSNPSIPNSSGGSSKSGGGGGGSSSAWLNPYDKFYNLLQDINAEIREREQLERDYNHILDNRNSTYYDISDNIEDQTQSLKDQIKLQEQLRAGRQGQIDDILNEKFEDANGTIRTYSSISGLSGYAKYDNTTGTIRIDYDALEKLTGSTDEVKTGAIEDYISRLEELQDQFIEANEDFEDLKDKLDEIIKLNREEYLDFEQRVYEAVVEAEQKMIDDYKDLSDSINEENEKILKSVQDSVDLSRQIRDNTKTSSEIADKEQKLAYLRRDTSNANDLLIKQLEKDIEDSRQSFGDSLVDQELQRLSKTNEEAAAQRNEMIEQMQAQLDWNKNNGYYWNQVNELLINSISDEGVLIQNSGLVTLLEQTESFKAMSEFGKLNWQDQLISKWLEAQTGKDSWQLEWAKKNGTTVSALGNSGTQSIRYDSATNKWLNADNNEVTNVGYDSAKNSYTYSDILTPILESLSDNNPTEPATTPTQEDFTLYTVKSGDTLSGIANRFNALGYNTNYHKIAADNNIADPNKIYIGEVFKIKKYLQGGLINGTGPIWVDGSTTKPEWVLSPEQTKGWLKLVDNLTSINGGVGDNYYNISINVDSIENDYDVDRMAERVKQIIVNDAQYRNVNTIRQIR